MSKNRRDTDYLHDIEEAIQRILDYTAGLTWQEFINDKKTQDAVVRNLEVIGEATKNLSEAIRAKYPKVKWQDMAGTRDRLTQHYFGVNQEIVWQIIEQDLPELIVQIKQIIGNH